MCDYTHLFPDIVREKYSLENIVSPNGNNIDMHTLALMHYNKKPKWSYNSNFGSANIIGCFSVFKFMHSFLAIALFLLFFFKIGGDFLKIFNCCRFVCRSRNKGKGNLKDKSLANDNCRRHSGLLSPSTTQLQSHINV